MPQIRTVRLDARNRLRGRAPGHDARAPYREAIAHVSETRMLELEPDDSKPMRGLKVNVARAAKEVNRSVNYGESDSGTLLVWLQDKPRKTRSVKKIRATTG